MKNLRLAFLSRGWRITPIVLLLGCSTPIVYAEEENPLEDSQILDSTEIDFGDRSLILNKVEPVELEPVQETIEQPKAEIQKVEIPDFEIQDQELASKTLTIFATVYPGKGSLVRLWDEEGWVVALSSVDFNYFRSLYHFEMGGIHYSAFFFVDTIYEEVPVGEYVPSFAGNTVEYALKKTEEDPKGDASKSLQLLHEYFQSNRSELEEKFIADEQARTEELQRQKETPKPKPDTVVHYFLSPESPRE